MEWSGERSGFEEVEGDRTSGAEVDRHALGVIRVDVHGGAGEHSVHGDGATKRIVDGAGGGNAVDVQLEGRANLLALEHVFHHPVGEGAVFVGQVDLARTVAIGETADVALERGVLAGSLTNGGNVDFAAADLEAPALDLGDGSVVGVVDLETVGADQRTSGGDVEDGAAGGGGDGKSTGGSRVAQHVVGGDGRQRRRQRASAGTTGLGVDDAEFDGIANLEVQVRLDHDGVGADGHIAATESSGSASGFVVEGTGSAAKNGYGHGSVPR